MLTNFGKRKKMSTAAFTSATRNALASLVEREAYRVKSRTVAYENVARTIGVSPSWIRKFLARDEAVAEPRMTLFQNIRASYDNLCSRVEQEHQNELLKLAALKGELNAVDQGFVSLANRTSESEVAGTESKS